jgi:uncharacterized protein (DUF1697 family)
MGSDLHPLRPATGSVVTRNVARKSSLILLLRGINVGSHKRVSMSDLRAALSEAGFADVRTYVQSGNVVISSRAAPAKVGAKAERLIAKRFGFDVDVIVRTAEDLAEVVARNPLGDVAADPKLYQVSFLDREPDPEAVARIGDLAADGERLVAVGREAYSWHPAGAARSKLWAKLAGNGLGIRGTSRNWTTVTTLCEMASEPGD